MPSDPPTTDALPQREREALADIAAFRSPYIWKQASMRKLEARGYVKQTGKSYGKAIAYVITDAGRAAL